MKVSPEYFIQLSHRVNTLHREKENFIESPGAKDRKVIDSPSEKGQGKHCKPRSKDRVDILTCVLTSPGQKTGHTNRETSRLKTGNNTRIKHCRQRIRAGVNNHND